MFTVFIAKKLRELILPVQQRIDDVREFLLDIDSTLEYDVVPIQDLYGPTRWDPDLDVGNTHMHTYLFIYATHSVASPT